MLTPCCYHEVLVEVLWVVCRSVHADTFSQDWTLQTAATTRVFNKQNEDGGGACLQRRGLSEEAGPVQPMSWIFLKVAADVSETNLSHWTFWALTCDGGRRQTPDL